MGRKRKEADRWMPSKLYAGKSAYEYRPKAGVCIRVCALSASKALVLRRFAEEYERYNTTAGSFSELAGDYLISHKFKKLANRTQKDYEGYWEKLKPVFGHVKVDSIKPEHIRQYMDKKGASSETQANRHHAFMSAVFAWGFERGKAKSNPCRGVSKFSEAARDRYIEDWEYAAVYEEASPALKAAMEISYLCAARQGDVVKLTKAQLLEEGIFIQQGKTGLKQIKKWSDRLRAAVALAASIETKIKTIYVIPTQTGTAYTSDGLRSIWHAAREAARRKTGKPLDFTFHDIKARAISDFEGDKQRFSGHKTPAQVQTYDRKTPVVDTLNLPTIPNGKNTK